MGDIKLISQFWRICERLSIIQAALLVAGHDPEEYEEYVEGWDLNQQPFQYHACKSAIVSAVEAKLIEGHLDYHSQGVYGESYTEVFRINDSSVQTESLIKWLKSHRITGGYFFPEQGWRRPYLDTKHPNYSPKLAAAVLAWESMQEEEQRTADTIKKSITVWLRRHANEFGFCDDDGHPQSTVVDALAKIVNWDTSGGAPKTPSKADNGKKSMLKYDADVSVKRSNAMKIQDVEEEGIPF